MNRNFDKVRLIKEKLIVLCIFIAFGLVNVTQKAGIGFDESYPRDISFLFTYLSLEHALSKLNELEFYLTHNPKVKGSNPFPATKEIRMAAGFADFFCHFAGGSIFLRSSFC